MAPAIRRRPRLRGRRLTASDRASATLVALVNDAAARKYWPGQDAYVPLAQERVKAATLVARTTRPPFDVQPDDIGVHAAAVDPLVALRHE